MIRINKTKYLVLGALSIRPMSGYDIKAWVINTANAFWSESPGQIYPALAALLKEALIEIKSEESVGNRPRKIYSIISEGEKVLQDWLVLPTEKSVERNELILKLFFGKNMSIKDNIEHIQRNKEEMKQARQYFGDKYNHIQLEHQSDPDALYWEITLKNAFHHIDAEIAWCDEVLEMLNKRGDEVCQ